MQIHSDENVHDTDILNKIAKEAILGFEETTIKGKEAERIFNQIKKEIAEMSKDIIVSLAKE